MKHDIIFNYVPPAYISMPAAAFSVLESYLEARGIVALFKRMAKKIRLDFVNMIIEPVK